MTLVTKDGKPYRTFSEPAKALSTQQLIDKEQLEFHNFGQSETTVAKAPPKAPPPAPLEPKIQVQSSQAKEFLNSLKEEAKALKEETPTAPESMGNETNAIIVHCHPATIKERKDDLYGDVRRTVKYGKKFVFEALLLDSNDFEIQLYTKTAISEGSIIYPAKYKDGESFAQYRWWEIKKKKERPDGGFLLSGIVTDQQRDFSD